MFPPSNESPPGDQARERRGGSPLLGKLVFTHILGWTQGAEGRNLALSLGERVARCRRFHQPERAG
jgi:hypothetical protein